MYRALSTSPVTGSDQPDKGTLGAAKWLRMKWPSVAETCRSMSGRKTPAQMGSGESTFKSAYEFDAGSGISISLSVAQWTAANWPKYSLFNFISPARHRRVVPNGHAVRPLTNRPRTCLDRGM